MSKTSAKIDYNGDIRLITFDAAVRDSYDKFIAAIRNAFQFKDNDELIVKYWDMDGDFITVTDSSFDFCFSDHSQNNHNHTKVIKFSVLSKQEEKPSTVPTGISLASSTAKVALPTPATPATPSSQPPSTGSTSNIQEDLYAFITFLQTTPSILTAVPAAIQSVLDAVIRGDNAEQIISIVLAAIPALKDNASLTRLLNHARSYFDVANQHLAQVRAVLVAMDPAILTTIKSLAVGMISQYFFRFTQYKPEEIIDKIKCKGNGCAFSNIGSNLFSQFHPLFSAFAGQFGSGLGQPSGSTSSSSSSSSSSNTSTSKQVESVPVPPVETSVHPDVTCDGCLQTPLQGVRYKCLTCDNFDVCAKCEARNDHDPTHSWLKIFPPSVVQATSQNESNNQVHHGVTCDVCGQFPIQGARWKCTQENWDCCGNCEKKNSHNPTHRLVQVPANGPRFPGGFFGRRFGRGRHHHPHPHPHGGWNFAEGRRCPGQNWRLGFGRGFGFDEDQQDKHLAAKFIDDANYPDRTEVPASSTIVKTWRVQNVGSAPWPANSKLIFLRGDREICMNEEYSVPVAQPNEVVEINAALVVPSVSGRYSAFFKLATENRETFFGSRLWVDLIVPDSNPISVTSPTSQTSSVPASAPVLTLPTPAQVNVPVAVPVIEPVSRNPTPSFEVQHEMLSSMGFNERNVNQTMLEEENGNLQAVVHRLLSQVKSSWN